MIQRIQTIFLLLAAVAFGLLFVWPFAASDQKDSALFQDNLYAINDHVLLMVLAGLGALVTLIAIFLYGNRATQLKLTYFTIILSILVPVFAVIFFMNQSGPSVVQADQIEDQAGMYMPVASLVFGILAMRFINKDNKIVKSMDRLR